MGVRSPRGEAGQPILCVFPEAPARDSGYGRVVARDLDFIRGRFPEREDVFFTSKASIPPGQRVPRLGKTSPLRMARFVYGRYPSSCPTANDLRQVLNQSPVRGWGGIFCGDSCLYPSLREMFPESHIYVRLHNVYATAWLRILQEGLARSRPLVFAEMFRYLRLELEIFRDSAATLIFLCREEAAFFRAMHPGRQAFVKGVFPAAVSPPRLRRMRRLAWVGGLSGHKLLSMQAFVTRQWPEIQSTGIVDGIDLYGKGTERFSGYPGVRGHGFLDDEGRLNLEETVFINPDYIGGGVKVKLLHYLETGAAFISTEVGRQGVSVPERPDCIVADLKDWAAELKRLQQYMKAGESASNRQS